MEEEIIKIFEINTDAIATNRGFYYQYLLVLKKWLKNYIDDKNAITLTEVEDDIKEIGDELIFTQVKCYRSSFSLNSVEVKKSLFNFYILYLKYKKTNADISFCFSTNTQISIKEKLLSKWVDDVDLSNGVLLGLCKKKISEILKKEIKSRKNKLLQKNISESQKKAIKDAFNNLIELLNENRIEPFVKSLVWEFDSVSPENAIEFSTKEIHDLLTDPKFENKPTTLLFSVLLSEIYRSSQRANESDRTLNNKMLTNLIHQTENELSQLIDNKLSKLLSLEIESLKVSVEAIRCTQEAHSTEISLIKEELKETIIQVPKFLNFLPDFSSVHILGWDDFLIKSQSILSEKKTLSIYSEGGMGKTSFGKKFLKTFVDYDHIIWLNVEHSISSALLLDNTLRENLSIKPLNDGDSQESAFKYLLNRLNKIEGNNLIIIDIQKSKYELSEINSLSLPPNWHKLILTRSHLKTIQNEKLPKLDFNNAKDIYITHCDHKPINDELLKEFFETIDYNILVIELVAKTIHNSFDLSLNSFLKSLKEQSLNKSEFKININISNENKSIIFFNYLLETFSLPTLDGNEKNYLEFLALLPSNNIIIEDLILINGKSHFEENKITILNILNSLDSKGLITINKDRKKFDIHKIIRETIVYNQRDNLNPFANNILFITWLTKRIEEGYYAPKNSFRYLKYAESILNSIKEGYRKSLYQPLPLLENEFFYAKRFYLGAKSNLTSLIDLAYRAENYPSLNKNNLGVIYNNLGLCYAENRKHDKAIVYFNKALKSYTKSEKGYSHLFITSLNNLSNIYLAKGDLIKVMECFKKVQDFRRKKSLYNDQQLSIEYRILAQSYTIAGSYEKAIKLLKSGIELHYTLDESNRNDFYLAAYHNELSNLYLVTENFNNAVENQEKGIKIMEDMGLINSNYLLSMYKISSNLYRFLGLKNKENEMSNKIELFKAYQS